MIATYNKETDYTVYGLSNEQYHKGEKERQYLSSSLLKKYLISPKAYRHAVDNPGEEQSDALRFGSLFHDLMASCATHSGDEFAAIRQWEQGIAVFTPPVNEKTGQPYGTATKAYKEAYGAFLQASDGKTIASQEEVDTATHMAMSLIGGCGATSEQVRKLLRWGRPEVSHFIEYEGCKFKWRPDRETRRKIVDWKTVSTDDLSERSINAQIARYGYDISAAFYLFMEHERTGTWKQFYWVFVSKQPPYDAVMVDASKWTYDYDPDSGTVLPQVGAIKMRALLDLHIKCTREQNWPGAEIYIPESDNGMRIMCPVPPPWEVGNAANISEQTY